MDEEQRIVDAMEHIRSFMQDNRPHTLSDFQQSGYDATTLQEAIRRLMEDERIVCQGNELHWRNEKKN